MSRSAGTRSRLTRLGCIVAAVGLTFTATLVSAQESSEVEGIRALLEGAQFREAMAAAATYLERTDLSAAQRNAGLEVLAIAQVASRREAEARATLETLYRRDPGHRLSDPDASPPVLSAFARAREAAPPPIPVSLDHTSPHPTRREPPQITVRVSEGADAVAEVRLIYRAEGESPARVVMAHRPDGTYAARIPVAGDPASQDEIRYHIVALAPSLTPLAHLGTEDDPLRVVLPAEAGGAVTAATPQPEPEEDGVRLFTTEQPEPEPATGGGSVAEEWWFWVLIVGIAAAGAGVTVGVLLGPAAQAPEAGTLGTTQLMLRF